jgi:hypothetical protein
MAIIKITKTNVRFPIFISRDRNQETDDRTQETGHDPIPEMIETLIGR